MVTLRRNATYQKLVAMKKLGFWGAVALIFNAATGPGLPFTPQSFQSPGYLFTILCFLLFAVVSGFSILFIIEAMQAIPANKHFQGNVEFATLINFYFEPKAHIAGQILLFGALVSNSVQSMVLSAQAIDKLVIDIFGKTCGFALSGPQLGWICVDAAGEMPSPFGDTYVLFSFGLLVVLIFVIPLGFSNLDDIIWVQYVAFILSILMVGQWVSAPFVAQLPLVNIPALTNGGNEYGSVIGTVMLNFAVTVIIPSWINMKSKEVNVQQAVWSSISAVVLFYVIPGILLAIGFSGLSSNVLTVLLASGKPALLTKITVYSFAFVMLIPAIPVNLLISKDNLVQNKVVSNRVAVFLTLILPWFIAIPFQTGILLEDFQTWTSLLFVSASNFMIPIIIFFKCKEFRSQYNKERRLTPRQLELLKQIHASSTKILGEIERRQVQLSDKNESEASIVTIDPNIPNMMIPTIDIPSGVDADCIEQSSSHANRQIGLLKVESTRMIFETLEDDVPDPDFEDRLIQRPTVMGTLKRKFKNHSTQDIHLETNSTENIIEVADGIALTKLPKSVTIRPRRSLGERSEIQNKNDNDRYGSSGTIDQEIKAIDLPFLDLSQGDEDGFVNDQYKVTRVSRVDANRLKSLPSNQKYRSPAFRSVPIWFPLTPSTVAYVLLGLTSFVTIGNIILIFIPQ
jgi:hypothetical protein